MGYLSNTILAKLLCYIICICVTYSIRSQRFNTHCPGDPDDPLGAPPAPAPRPLPASPPQHVQHDP